MLHAACQQSGPAVGEPVGGVPHYIAAAPNPKAALALVRKLEGLVGVAVDASELERAAADYDRQVNLAVQSDPDVQAFVERLEQAAEPERSEERPGSAAVRRHDRARAPALPAPARRSVRPGTARPAPAAVRSALGGGPLLALGGRADQPVVAHRARRVRRRRLEPLRRGSRRRPRSPTSSIHSHRSPSIAGHGDLLVVEHVVVGLLRRIELPGLAGADRVQRQLDVVAQLLGALGPPGLVVDQLVVAAGQPVDAVDAPAEQMRPSLNVNERSNQSGSRLRDWKRSW